MAGETKTATALEAILHKIQNSDIKANTLQREMQEQKKEIQDMGEKVNAVLAEMQVGSLRFDLLYGGGMDFNLENTEGAN